MAGRKVFQPAEILYSADVNDYLMDQSVMVFADASARSSAIGTPTAGMVTYLTGTGALQVYGTAWSNVNDNTASVPLNTVTTAGDLIVANGNASVTRLGIGSNGQVLSSNGTTATWVSPTSGGMALLSSGSLSGTTLSLTSISQSYKALRLIISGYAASNGYNTITLKNGSTTQNVNYSYDRYSGSNLINLHYGNLAVIGIEDGSTASASGAIIFQLDNYANSGAKAFMLYGAPQATNIRSAWIRGAVRDGTSSIDAIEFSNSTSYTAGTYILYGVN